ncbi:MAG: helix-turn-helix transcriptional regulator [Betaproteobacteria bacterium]|nr:helix-turn-helix transcriptional regulator [Betaproteobacteria bacterium]
MVHVMENKTKKTLRTTANAAHKPVSAMVEDIVGCKWSLSVMRLVRDGVNRPGAMQKAVEGLSTKVLNERLRKLQRFGILEKHAYPEVPPRVEYQLTKFGEQFSVVLDGVDRLQAWLDTHR